MNLATTRIAMWAVMLVLLNAASATALCGTDGQGPCYRFWKVDAVFVAKVLDKIPIREWAPSGDLLPSEIVIGNSSARLQVRVAEAFRGVEAGAVLTLFAPDDVCGSVNARNGGELFVYASRNKAGELWAAGCGVSGPLENAVADLEYARSISRHGPAARVYGSVVQREEQYGDSRDFSAIEGVRVRIVGKNFSADAFTDEHGGYAITLPGAGAYQIKAYPPDGMVNRFEETVRFEIGDPRACFHEAFQFRLSGGAIRGRVIDADGEPVPDLVLSTGRRERFATTDASGEFEIGQLSEGGYRIEPVMVSERSLKLETPAPVEVLQGKVTEISPLIAIVTDRLVSLSIDLAGNDAGDVLIEVVAKPDGDRVGPIRVTGRSLRFRVERDQSFEIVAVSRTHHATTVVRSDSSETAVTLTLRPLPQ